MADKKTVTLELSVKVAGYLVRCIERDSSVVPEREDTPLSAVHRACDRMIDSKIE